MSNTNSFPLRRACKPALYAAAMLSALALAIPSQAQITLLTSAQLSSQNATINYTGTAGTILTNPYTVTLSNPAQTITFTNNGNFYRTDQQGPTSPTGNFGGDFASGTALLRSAGVGSGAGGAFTLTFSRPISQIGFFYEPNATPALFAPPISDTFTFRVFENGGASPAFTTTQVSQNSGGLGSPTFFGVNDAGGNRITSIQVFGASTDDIVFSPMGVSNSAVPEPGALALLAGAGLPIGLLAARRRRRGQSA